MRQDKRNKHFKISQLLEILSLLNDAAISYYATFHHTLKKDKLQAKVIAHLSYISLCHEFLELHELLYGDPIKLRRVYIPYNADVTNLEEIEYRLHNFALDTYKIIRILKSPPKEEIKIDEDLDKELLPTENAAKTVYEKLKETLQEVYCLLTRDKIFSFYHSL